jgi:hypothetical protein
MLATGGTHCRPPDLRLAFLCCRGTKLQTPRHGKPRSGPGTVPNQEAEEIFEVLRRHMGGAAINVRRPKLVPRNKRVKRIKWPKKIGFRHSDTPTPHVGHSQCRLHHVAHIQLAGFPPFCDIPGARYACAILPLLMRQH